MTKLTEINVAFTMHGPGGSYEATTALFVRPEIAASLMAGNYSDAVDTILDNVARLRGYRRAEFDGIVDSNDAEGNC